MFFAYIEFTNGAWREDKLLMSWLAVGILNIILASQYQKRAFLGKELLCVVSLMGNALLFFFGSVFYFLDKAGEHQMTGLLMTVSALVGIFYAHIEQGMKQPDGNDIAARLEDTAHRLEKLSDSKWLFGAGLYLLGIVFKYFDGLSGNQLLVPALVFCSFIMMALILTVTWRWHKAAQKYRHAALLAREGMDEAEARKKAGIH